LNPDVKVLLASGYSMNGQAAAILERGCNGFHPETLHHQGPFGKLREILKKKRSTDFPNSQFDMPRPFIL